VSRLVYRRRRKKRSRVKWKEKNNPKEDSSKSDGGDTGTNTVFPNVSDITALPRHFTFWPLAAM
jgi:hypothetical protein